MHGRDRSARTASSEHAPLQQYHRPDLSASGNAPWEARAPGRGDAYCIEAGERAPRVAPDTFGAGHAADWDGRGPRGSRRGPAASPASGAGLCAGVPAHQDAAWPQAREQQSWQPPGTPAADPLQAPGRRGGPRLAAERGTPGHGPRRAAGGLGGPQQRDAHQQRRSNEHWHRSPHGDARQAPGPDQGGPREHARPLNGNGRPGPPRPAPPRPVPAESAANAHGAANGDSGAPDHGRRGGGGAPGEPLPARVPLHAEQWRAQPNPAMARATGHTANGYHGDARALVELAAGRMPRRRASRRGRAEGKGGEPHEGGLAKAAAAAAAEAEAEASGGAGSGDGGDEVAEEVAECVICCDPLEVPHPRAPLPGRLSLCRITGLQL